MDILQLRKETKDDTQSAIKKTDSQNNRINPNKRIKDTPFWRKWSNLGEHGMKIPKARVNMDLVF